VILCAHCQQPLKTQQLGDMMGIFPTSAYYCENKECPRVFLLAMGGYIVPAKTEAKEDSISKGEPQ
jgi:hypothetical protein